MVNSLTQEQLDFLKKHKISSEQIFDAKGMSNSEYKPLMKKLGKIVAYNVTPCKKAGHMLRTRSGHCIQCQPAAIAFQMRNDASGVVYVAGSKEGHIIKVGYSKALEIRSESLNRTKYAGFSDWEILYAISSNMAGVIEVDIKSMLERYEYVYQYSHDGNVHNSDETYSCSYSNAKEALINVCKKEKHKYEILEELRGTGYDFRNLVRK